MQATESFFPSPRRTHRNRRLWVGVWAAALVLTPLLAAPAAASTPLGNPSVISEWSLLAESTFRKDTANKLVQEAFLYTAFADAAMYDAVVGIDGRYQPYSFHVHAPSGASDQAAAIAAAHRIITTYSPYATATVDARRDASLALIPDSQAKADGIAYGIAAADNLIALRPHDGRNAPIFFTKTPAPGVWRPTPPGLLDMAVPWMSAVTPLLVKRPSQFGDPGPPPPMTSKRYTRDFNEVKSLGSATSTTRTAAQTATAMFFSGNASLQYYAALANQMQVRHMDIVDSARLFAAVGMSMADAVISVWYAKYKYGFWRPITAIQEADSDGNPATAQDTDWVPLVATPPYPEYVSGYSGVTGAFSRALARTLGTSNLDLTLISTAVPGVTRHYSSQHALAGDLISARVWLGFHFRFSDTAGVKMGQHVANWALGHYFQPLGD